MPGIISTMNIPKQTVHELMELVNHYPSPHNGQPIILKPVTDNTFELYFDKSRGLQAVDISYIFSFVSMGVFKEHMAKCASALGHGIDFMIELPKEKDLRGEGLVKFASCHIEWNVSRPDRKSVEIILFRQTSRKKYYEGITQAEANTVNKIAADNKMILAQIPKQQTKQAIWLNQRAVFDDMFDEPVRHELDHWLRYTQRQKQVKKDGLSYDCMELNGRLLKYTVDHPKILRAPVISGFIKQYYLHTMKDASDVCYMMAPFKTPQDALNAGIVIMKIWIELSGQDYYLHPFGTIMSNSAAQ